MSTTEPAPTGLGLNHEVGTSLRITMAGEELTRYVYRPWDPQYESPKPYFHPLRTLGGDLVSLYRPWDHLWHKGIAWSLPNIGTENFWGGPTYVRESGYQRLNNDGSQDHEEFAVLDADAQSVRVAEQLRWHTQAGQEWFTERRRFVVSVDPDADAWTLIFESSMTNISGKTVGFGSPTTRGRDNAGYGGLFWRGPRSFSDGHVLMPGGVTGGDDLMGTRGEWLAYVGRHDDHGRSSTLVFVDDESNGAEPVKWFVRTSAYACVCPAPFFDVEIPVEPGESLVRRYAVVVADGDRDAAGSQRLAEAGKSALSIVHKEW